MKLQPITTLPDDRKDGRLVFLAVPGSLYEPWLYYIARWEEGLYLYDPTSERFYQGAGWETTETAQDDCLTLRPDEPAYWADINPPEAA
jgi:hypothetical protein